MTHADAVAFLAPAGPFHGTWADIGAGAGAFARALAELLGPDGAVIAIDTDERALAALRSGAGENSGGAEITTLRGDMHALDAIVGLEGVQFDGLLLANVLHFTRTPGDVLARAAERLKAEGRIVVIEYERRMPNPWVPHPLPLARLAEVAARAGLGVPREVARRASEYHREMYCAVLEAAA